MPGVPPCHLRSCTHWNGTMCCCIPQCLLPSVPCRHQWTHHHQTWEGNCMVSWISRKFSCPWSATNRVLPSTPTLNYSLFSSNTRIRCPSGTLFIHHWVTTHHGCQATMATVKLSQRLRADVAHKPTAWQTQCHTQWIRASTPAPSFPWTPTKTCIDARRRWRRRSNRWICYRHCNIGKNMLYVLRPDIDQLY